MSSPVFHGLAGAGIAYAMTGDARLSLWRSLRKAAPWLFAGAVLACLPDLDYLPGLITGALNTAHQKGTHSLIWVVSVSAVLWLAGRIWKPAWFRWRAAVLIFLLTGSHLAIDLVTADHSRPYGIPLWAPFSDQTVLSPVTVMPSWKKDTLADVWNPANWRPLAIELGAGLAFAAGCIALRRFRPSRVRPDQPDAKAGKERLDAVPGGAMMPP